MSESSTGTSSYDCSAGTTIIHGGELLFLQAVETRRVLDIDMDVECHSFASSVFV